MRKQETTTTPKPPFPSVETEEVKDKVSKTETINFRLTADEKKSIMATASALKLTVSEYLVKCHEMIASKVELQK